MIVIVEITLAIGLALFGFYLVYFLLMWIKNRGWKPLSASENFAPPVSLIVPTYNEEDTIVHKLKNLMEQNYSAMEIVIVDGASQDRTLELIGKFVENNGLSVKLIRQNERRGKASALNEAFKHCSGEIIVMTDADAVWEKDTLRKAVSSFSDPDIGAVTGRQILLNPNQSLATKVEKTYRNIYEVLRVGESVIDSTPIFHGEISCFRRSLIENVSEDSMADDSELAVKIRRKGFRSVYVRDAVFYEHAPPTFRSRFTQKLRRGQGLIQLFLREGGILFNPKYGKFGTFIFPAEFFMHVISPVLVFSFLVLFSWSTVLTGNYVLIGLGITSVFFLVISTVLKIDKLNVPLSYLSSQFILLLSLMYQILGKSQHKWKKVAEIRKLWKDRQASQDQAS